LTIDEEDVIQSYHSYVIRCWSEGDVQQQPVWRFVLEIPATGKRQGFSTFTQLTSALETRLQHMPESDMPDESNGGEQCDDALIRISRSKLEEWASSDAHRFASEDANSASIY
jgi:hypothetical protein